MDVNKQFVKDSKHTQNLSKVNSTSKKALSL